MLKNLNLNPKELGFIESLEKILKIRCQVQKEIDIDSDKVGTEKITKARFYVRIKDQKISEFAIIGARFSEFPLEIPIMHEMKSFTIIKSNLEKFPESLCKSQSLTKVDISYNNIDSIPECISNLSSLKELNLTQNNIKMIPPQLLNLHKLEKIEIKGNPVDNLPQNYPNLNVLSDKYFKRGLNKSESNFLTHLEIITGEELQQVHHRGILNGYYLQNKSITWLRIFNENLKTLPKNVSNLKNLLTLNLSGEPEREEQGILGKRNGVEQLPNTIGNLKRLKWIYLSKSKLKSIPKEIGHIENLQQLYISDNFLESIPNSLKNLQSLKYLDLRKNGLTDIPDWISNLSNLQNLNLSNNRIVKIPNELSKIPSLKLLKIDNNYIQNIPTEIGNLKNLQILDLSNNSLVSESLMPIFKLQNLKHLDLSYNSDISFLDESINNLTNLEMLNLEGNQFTSIPPSIWGLGNLFELRLKKNPFDDENLDLINRDLQFILEYCRKKANIHIFFSHAVEDYDKFNLINLIEFLEQQPEIYEVMYCERDLTGNIDKFMNDNIPKSNLLLFFATNKSVFNSDDCKTEIELARKNEIEIIPIKSDEVTWEDLSTVGLKRELGKDYTGNTDDFGKELYEYIKTFKRNINLFEKEKAKIDKIKLRFRNEFNKILNSTEVENIIKDNYETILQQIEEVDKFDKNLLKLFDNLVNFKNETN
ncbi:MAG: leucine-rich repeat domain-containing protein [Candidatus Hermodarchaeota archaeon]